MKVGDIVKYRSRWGRVTCGMIVEQGGCLATTPIWVVQRIKSGYEGQPIRAHVLQGDILEVISESR